MENIECRSSPERSNNANVYKINKHASGPVNIRSIRKYASFATLIERMNQCWKKYRDKLFISSGMLQDLLWKRFM